MQTARLTRDMLPRVGTENDGSSSCWQVRAKIADFHEVIDRAVEARSRALGSFLARPDVVGVAPPQHRLEPLSRGPQSGFPATSGKAITYWSESSTGGPGLGTESSGAGANRAWSSGGDTVPAAVAGGFSLPPSQHMTRPPTAVSGGSLCYPAAR